MKSGRPTGMRRPPEHNAPLGESHTKMNTTNPTGQADTSGETFEAKLTARRICRFCREPFKVNVEIAGTMHEIVANTRQSIAEELEEQGWVSGSCPPCAFAHKNELHQEHHADARQEMEAVS